MRPRVFLAAVVAGLLPGAPAAQTPSPPPAQSPAVFRSGVDLVRLDIRVTDGRGRPIDDLRPEEVRIKDGGEERPVLLFQHIAESGRSYLEAAQRTIASEVSTNQGAPRGQLYVLLFDQDHISLGAELRVRQAAETFLRAHVRAQDRVALYGLPGPGPDLAFTARLPAALEQLKLVRGGLQRLVPSTIGDMTLEEAYQIVRGNDVVLSRFTMPSSTGSGATSRTSAYVDLLTKARAGDSSEQIGQAVKENAETIVHQADATTRAFLQLAANTLRNMRDVDGRKTVILFSEGFYGDNVQREIQNVAAAAAETYAVVYAFDLNRRTENMGPEALGNDAASEIASRLEPIGSLASETNGDLVIDAVSHLDQALGQLGNANSDYYLVGFTPPPEALDHRETYRRVSVSVTRPGAMVSARTGYSEGPAVTAADRRREIDGALAAPFGEQGLHVEYTTYLTRSDVPNLDRVVLSLDTQLPVGRRAGDNADVVFVVRNARTGQVAASGTDQVPLPKAAAPGSSMGLASWHVQFTLPSGSYLMRCVVREPGGLIGSADRQFEVRSLSGPDVAASDLFLGSVNAGLPVRAHAYTSSPFGGIVRLYGRSADQLTHVTAALELIPLGADRPALTVTGAPGDVRGIDTQVQRDVAFDIPLDRVPPGEYIARAVVRDAGGTVADLRRQLVVSAGASPAGAGTPDAVVAPLPRDAANGVIAERLIARAGRSEDAAVRRAAAAAQVGQWAAALSDLKSAGAGADQVSLNGLALLAQERYEESAAALADAAGSRPNDATLAFLLGWARTGAGSEAGAIEAFRSAAALEPTMVPAHLALAQAYLHGGQTNAAIQALQNGLAKVPDSYELKQMLESIRREKSQRRP